MRELLIYLHVEERRLGPYEFPLATADDADECVRDAIELAIDDGDIAASDIEQVTSSVCFKGDPPPSSGPLRYLYQLLARAGRGPNVSQPSETSPARSYGGDRRRG